MPETEINPQYTAPSPDLLIARPLDGLVALYHRPSGQTHVVASPVPEIIETLQAEGPVSVRVLLAALGLSEGEDLLAARLSELAAVGLVAQQ
jgi:PqqD family protein of HPr-rel-A system